VRFCFFTHMPWRFQPERPASWPPPNSDFEPVRGSTELNAYFQQVKLAEDVGFDCVGFGEEHSNPFGLVPNACLAGSYAAAITKRVRIAVMGAPIPLLNPIRVAEEYAWLDVVTGGRLEAGLLRGVPQNYFAYNVDPDESWDRYAEALELICTAWNSTTPFPWSSRFYHFPSVSVWPRPLQTPFPPVLISAGSSRSIELAAAVGARVGEIHLTSPSALTAVGERFRQYKRLCREKWGDVPTHATWIGVYGCVAPTDHEARSLFFPAVEYLFQVLSGGFETNKAKVLANTSYAGGQKAPPAARPALSPQERLEAGLVVCGSPETVAGQLARIHEVTGASTISLHLQVGNMDPEAACQSIRLTGEYIIPRFRPPVEAVQ
jgi:alkanesulfonate monooxygenase SsuD/methylene tetrahydromethanopterin reductase-like flavin-dependent oxidoreductase (luciferase family)